MDFEEVLQILQKVVFLKTGKHLTDVDLIVLRGTYQHQGYAQIATSTRYAESYLKKDVGPKLWKLLSKVLDEHVTKHNCSQVLERRVNQSLQRLYETGVLSSSPAIASGSASNALLSTADVGLSGTASSFPQQDWGDAPDVTCFYGRTQELLILEDWIQQQGCRVVTLVGMGGIGKTSLTVKLGQQLVGMRTWEPESHTTTHPPPDSPPTLGSANAPPQRDAGR